MNQPANQSVMHSDNISASAPRIALYAGSVSPFTIGHRSVLERALQIFDRVIVMVGVNPSKPRRQDYVDALQAFIDKTPRAELLLWDGLTVDAARSHGARWLVRGARTVADFEYERTLADVNRAIAGLETVILLAEPELSMISSSMVRELQSHGHDVTPYLP